MRVEQYYVGGAGIFTLLALIIREIRFQESAPKDAPFENDSFLAKHMTKDLWNSESVV
jgi:hypothetical protein